MRNSKRLLWAGMATVLAALMALTLGLAFTARAANFNIACGDTAGLISAINTANGNGQADTISLSACTYTLTAVNNITDGENGLPAITSPITITGNGSMIERSSLGGTPNFRIFHVGAVGNLTLVGLTVRNGRIGDEDGAGIRISGGTITIIDSSIISNTQSGFNNFGGGIAVLHGNMNLISSTVTQNIAENAGGIYSADSMLEVTNSAIAGNIANDIIGGIFIAEGSMNLIGSTVSQNIASAAGGIHAVSSVLEVTNSAITGNIANGETLGFAQGGGIIVLGSTLTMTSSTIGDNTATDSFDTGWAGGLNVLSDSKVSLINVSVTGNYAGTLGAGGIGIAGGTSAELINTIVANNVSSIPHQSDCRDPITSKGHNLDSDGSCGLTASGDISNTNALLGPLQLNAPGSTATHALLPGSPAINAGDSSACPSTDQRGIARPQGPGCDIGAFEFQLPTLNVRAFIDGRSQLIVQGSTAYWHHFDFSAPGREGGVFEPTYLNGTAWLPEWPDDPDPGNGHCDCDSLNSSGVPPLGQPSQPVAMGVAQARDFVTIVQQPHASNGYTLIVEFNDNASGGADWYEVDLVYPQPSLQPSTLNIWAYVDGRSRLMMQGDSVTWHHVSKAAPGRIGGATLPTYVNAAAWFPEWPDAPDAENRDCDCDSVDSFTNIPPLVPIDQTVTLGLFRARDSATIIQQPDAGNDYTLIVEFDDLGPPGADWYVVNLNYMAEYSSYLPNIEK